MKALYIFLSLILGVFPFKTGSLESNSEKQVYVVHYQWGVLNADVARITASCESVLWHGEPAYKARIYGKTAKFCESIVKVREDFTSTFTAADMRPVKSSRKALEAKYNGGETYKYDWENGLLEMTISSNKSSERKKEFSLEEGTLDVPSLYYAVRSIDLEKVSDGKPFAIRVALGDAVETISMRYDGLQTLQARGIDKTTAHKLSISITSGNTFDPKKNVVIYLSDGDVHIPLYFEAPLKLGKVTGRLESSTGK